MHACLMLRANNMPSIKSAVLCLTLKLMKIVVYVGADRVPNFAELTMIARTFASNQSKKNTRRQIKHYFIN